MPGLQGGGCWVAGVGGEAVGRSRQPSMSGNCGSGHPVPWLRLTQISLKPSLMLQGADTEQLGTAALSCNSRAYCQRKLAVQPTNRRRRRSAQNLQGTNATSMVLPRRISPASTTLCCNGCTERRAPPRSEAVSGRRWHRAAAPTTGPRHRRDGVKSVGARSTWRGKRERLRRSPGGHRRRSAAAARGSHAGS